MDDFADNSTYVLQNIRDGLEHIGIVLDRFGHVRRSLIVITATIAILVQEVRVDLWG